MPRISSMHAGAGGTAHNVNMNGPNGGGNKLQGLPPIRNMRSGLVKYVNTRARGDNRNVVFCMNQLGGVGRKSNMFATTADGVKKPCHGSATSCPPVFTRCVALGSNLLRFYIKVPTATTKEDMLNNAAEHLVEAGWTLGDGNGNTVTWESGTKQYYAKNDARLYLWNQVYLINGVSYVRGWYYAFDCPFSPCPDELKIDEVNQIPNAVHSFSAELN